MDMAHNMAHHALECLPFSQGKYIIDLVTHGNCWLSSGFNLTNLSIIHMRYITMRSAVSGEKMVNKRAMHYLKKNQLFLSIPLFGGAYIGSFGSIRYVEYSPL